MTIPVYFGDPRLPERFWNKCEAITETGCWIWTAHTNRQGRPRIFKGRQSNGKKITVQSHRLAYEVLIGPIPNELELDHKCAIIYCVNPNHLQPVTRSENERRKGGSMFNGWQTAYWKVCKRGHSGNRNKWGGCIDCLKITSRNHYLKKRNAVQKVDNQS